MPPAPRYIIQAAVVLGPVLAVMIVVAKSLFTTGTPNLSTATSLMCVVWLFGLIPSVLGGILFAFSRRLFGSGYLVAILCGWTVAFFYLPLLLEFVSPPDMIMGWKEAAIEALYVGALPALIIRLLTRRWFLLQPKSGP